MSIDWSAEPDLEALRNAIGDLSKRPAQAIEELKALAERGSIMSMYYLGVVYERGEAAPADLNRAEFWYKKMSETGSVLGSYYLGLIYKRSGRYDEALKQFEIGEVADFGPSLNALAGMYYHGLGVRRDRGKAKTLWLKAIDLGHIHSKRNLGRHSLYGGYGPRSIPQGVRLLFGAAADFAQEKDDFSDRLR